MRKTVIITAVIAVFLALIVGSLYYLLTKMTSQMKQNENKTTPPVWKNVLMIVAPVNYRDEELNEPREIFNKAGCKVTIASKGVNSAKGMMGGSTPVAIDISEVNVKEYDAVVFVGGSGASVYFKDRTALNIAKEAVSAGKVVGAICIAPSILANAGVLSGKNATSFPSEADNLRAKGANYTGDSVTVDSGIITGKGPEAAKEFANRIVEALRQK